MGGKTFWMVVSGVLALALFLMLTVKVQDPGEVEPASSEQLYIPEFGSNDVFREVTHAAPGHELLVADLRLPPDAVGDAHYHPWEEYLYVIGGSAVLEVEGMEPRELVAGEGFVIPRETVHTPRAGPDGIRAIVVRVHDEGDPVRVLVENPAE